MNEKVLILHGWGGSNPPHWQSKLAAHIAANYGTVCFPELKSYDTPIKSEWIAQVKAILEDFRPTTVVTHSLGSTLWFWLTQEDINPIQKLYLVAPPSMNCTIQELSSFFPCPTPSDLKAKEAHIIVSNDDPYITMDEANELAKTLHIPLRTLQKAGHINSESGYGRWEWIEQQFD